MRQLSHKTASFTESVIREMTRLCDAAGGYNMSQGFPDFQIPGELKQAAIDAINQDWNQYPVTFGEPELRHAIACKAKVYNGISIDPETEITVTCGATEAMMATLTALINPGDEIVVFEPFYENYGPDSILSGATPRYVTLHAPDWSFRPDELAAAFNGRTKAIVINTPNNPTGKVFSRKELTQIAELCQKWDCYAVTDEIYEHILFDGAEHISIASMPGMWERSITINSISKTYSVTGWRVGWAIAPRPITQQIRKVHDFLTVGAPTPFQHAAVTALSFPSSYYDGLRAHYTEARAFLLDTLTNAGFECCQPKGAYYILAGISHIKERFNVTDDISFSRAFLEHTGIAVVPGSAFYALPERGSELVRFAFCKKWETLVLVAARLNGFRND